jgi:Chaperone of endosialidase
MKNNPMITCGSSVLVAILFSTVLQAQNVGIGVTNPQSKLSVNGTTSSGGLAIGDSTYTSTAATVAPANGALIQGSVGIGITTPQGLLHVNGQVYVAGPGVTGSLEFGTANQDGVRIYPGAIDVQRNQFNCLHLAKPAGAVDGGLAAFFSGGTAVGTITTSGGTVSYNTTSDERLKENIRPSAKGLSKVMKIQVRDYVFKSKPGQNETGFIAQQLYTVLPDVVTKGGEDPAKEPWSVDYGRVTPFLTKAIQEQQAEIEILKEQIGRQDVRLKALKAENVRLQADADKVSVVEAENAHLKGKTDKLAAKMEALEKTMAAIQTKDGRAVHAVALSK